MKDNKKFTYEEIEKVLNDIILRIYKITVADCESISVNISDTDWSRLVVRADLLSALLEPAFEYMILHADVSEEIKIGLIDAFEELYNKSLKKAKEEYEKEEYEKDI